MTFIIAIIGLGQMGASYAKYASNIANKVVCYDNNKNQSATFHSKVLNDNNPFDVNKVVSIDITKIEIVDTLDAIWEQQPNLTIITTHKDSHCYYSCLAMHCGSHVLTEKPLCITLEEAEELKNTSFMTKKKLFIGFSLHATPAFLKLREIINCNYNLLKKYQVYRIGAVPEDYMDRVSARFDLLSHDTDFCLQMFKMPDHTFVEEISARECNKFWEYPGFQIEMIGRMPIIHPGGFEYGFELIYEDDTSVVFSNTDTNNLVIKNSCKEIIEIIPITSYSSCQKILEKTISSINNDDYDHYLHHELSIVNGVKCMNMLVNDHRSGLDD